MKDLEKKVLAIVPSLSKRSGAGRMTREIVSRLAHVTNLLVLTEIHTGTNEFNDQAVLEPRTSLFGFIRNCIRSRKAAKGVSVVHAFDAWPYGVYGYAAVVGTKRRLFINGVGTYSVAPLTRFPTRILLTLAYRRATEIFCISAYTKKRIDERLPRLPTTIMHLGTTRLPVPTKQKIIDLRERLSIPQDAYPIVITVGEIKERKGQLDTLEALVSLTKELPHSFYIMAGSDTDTYVATVREFAEQSAQPICITSDLKSDEDLACLYSIADIFTLNSNNHETHFEGFGLVILEAAQFGVPAIGSRDCGIEDAISDGISGILVNQMDHIGIANAMQKILKNRDVFKLGTLAWYTRFSWENTISVIMSAYDR